jgi:hypothetical protein
MELPFGWRRVTGIRRLDRRVHPTGTKKVGPGGNFRGKIASNKGLRRGAARNFFGTGIAPSESEMDMEMTLTSRDAGTWSLASGQILAKRTQIRWNFFAKIASTHGGSHFSLDNQGKIINT